MRVALFVPCYVDTLFPDAGMATLEVLERAGIDVDYPVDQTCCGQPLVNTGCVDDARPVARHFVDVFGAEPWDWIVCPSGSCTSMVRNHYDDLVDAAEADRARAVREKTVELCEFLHDVVGVDAAGIDARFPHRVGLHAACHGMRELRLGSVSERMVPKFSKIRALLDRVRDLELVELERPDECCGFGGTFAVHEEAVSVRMGRDRVADHRQAGADVIVSTDSSCLMHLGGLIQRDGGDGPRTMHVAEVLAGRVPA